MQAPKRSHNILITGLPGSGKTTLVEKLIAGFPHKKGFITREIRHSGRRTGFEIVTSDGERKPLASVDIDSPYRVSKYKVDVRGFDSVIQRFFNVSDNELLYIDEIGKMELFSERFRELVTEYLNAGNLFIATIAMKSNDPFINGIKKRSDVSLFTVDWSNRNDMYDKVMKYLGNRYSASG